MSDATVDTYTCLPTAAYGNRELDSLVLGIAQLSIDVLRLYLAYVEISFLFQADHSFSLSCTVFGITERITGTWAHQGTVLTLQHSGIEETFRCDLHGNALALSQSSFTLLFARTDTPAGQASVSAPLQQNTPPAAHTGLPPYNAIVLQTAKSYDQQPTPAAENNCKEFVRYVYKLALGVDTPATSENGNGMEWPAYKTMGFTKVAQVRFGSHASLKALQDFFIAVSPGDAIQIKWNNSSHSMFFNSYIFDSNGNTIGVSVVDTNVISDKRYVYVRDVLWEELQRFFTTKGLGMTAYRYIGYN